MTVSRFNRLSVLILDGLFVPLRKLELVDGIGILNFGLRLVIANPVVRIVVSFSSVDGAGLTVD